MEEKRVATKKVHKKRLKIKNVLIILSIILLGGFCCYAYRNIKLQRIIIKGTTELKDNDLIRLANLDNYPKIGDIKVKDIKKKLLTNPLIDSVKVSKNVLGYVTLDINEAIVLFYNKSQNKTILSNGKGIDDKNFASLPILINYVPDEIYEELITGLKKIDKDIRALISEIEYSPSKDANGETLDDTRFVLRMNDGNTVYMNTINIGKLNSYIKIFSTTDMPSKKGVLYLDSRTDNVVFKTYESIAEEEAKKEAEAKEKEEEQEKEENS